MTERKELRNLQLENVRLETELTEASQRLEDQAAEHSRNETHLQTEVNKLIDSLRDEKVRLFLDSNLLLSLPKSKHLWIHQVPPLFCSSLLRAPRPTISNAQ